MNKLLFSHHRILHSQTNDSDSNLDDFSSIVNEGRFLESYIPFLSSLKIKIVLKITCKCKRAC